MEQSSRSEATELDLFLVQKEKNSFFLKPILLVRKPAEGQETAAYQLGRKNAKPGQ